LLTNRVSTGQTGRNRAYRSGQEGLALCGIISRDGGPSARIADAEIVDFRDLGALVRKSRFAPLPIAGDEVAAYRSVVEGAFVSRPIIPAAFGTIFRHRDSLLRWLELHYFTLADTLRYLQDRAAARVRVSPGLGTQGWDTREHRQREVDLEVTAFDSFRVLKRQAVAFVPIDPHGRRTEEGAEGAFLVERDQWNAFTALVKEEQRRLPDLRFEQSGPWPPYDFVRLELNG
jgi:hypothetical protein